MNSEKEIEKHFNDKIQSLKNERDRCLRSFRMSLKDVNIVKENTIEIESEIDYGNM